MEANNLSPWKTVPQECGDYVEGYMTGKGYQMDLQRVSNEAVIFARSLNLSRDGKDAWIFDVDETLLSNVPYYANHAYGYPILNMNSSALIFYVLDLILFLVFLMSV